MPKSIANWLKQSVVLPSAALLLIAGCATQEKQVVAPQPDQNALKLMDAVKETPSQISGGGMIYDLFVGGHFDARYDDRAGSLVLTDISNDNVCKYAADGTLQVGDTAGEDHNEMCKQLSINALDFLTQ